ncbi:MAG: MerR family transcriptional regulator [Eggerthella lenta]
MTLPRLYDIKEAARYLGVASSTLRYWESEVVQAGRGEANGYRQYSLHDLIEASEIAFYRKLGVPVKELRGYQRFRRAAWTGLARTEDGVEQRIAELEATKARLARQRAQRESRGAATGGHAARLPGHRQPERHRLRCRGSLEAARGGALALRGGRLCGQA